MNAIETRQSNLSSTKCSEERNAESSDVGLGGGRGTRLYPLTKYRSKPAVPVAGKYRLIDIPLSNCINSGLNRIYVLTQFNSVSLHRHIRRTYTFDPFDGGFVEILAAQQTLDNADWYQGTADAVRQNLRYVEQPGIEYVLILSGDQLYRMNFQRDDRHAPAGRGRRDDRRRAGRPPRRPRGWASCGWTTTGRVVGFLEKPKTEKEIEHRAHRSRPGSTPTGIASRGRDCLASMGIYLFNRDTLVDVLSKTDYRDFGKEVFPASIRTRHVQVHLFDGYWEDIGTINSFYEANLELATPERAVRAGRRPTAPIYTRARFLPPTRLDGATVRGSLMADGCVIERGRGDREQRDRPALPHRPQRGDPQLGPDGRRLLRDARRIGGLGRGDGKPPLGIGEGTRIEGAIIDKNCRIGRNVRIVNERGVETTEETPDGMIRDGIACVQKGAVLPDGWRM